MRAPKVSECLIALLLVSGLSVFHSSQSDAAGAKTGRISKVKKSRLKTQALRKVARKNNGGKLHSATSKTLWVAQMRSPNRNQEKVDRRPKKFDKGIKQVQNSHVLSLLSTRAQNTQPFWVAVVPVDAKHVLLVTPRNSDYPKGRVDIGVRATQTGRVQFHVHASADLKGVRKGLLTADSVSKALITHAKMLGEGSRKFADYHVPTDTLANYLAPVK